VFLLPDFERAGPDGESYLEPRTFAELLIDCQEDRALMIDEGDFWDLDPTCSLYALVRCPGLAVDMQRATCD
jgi:hypothetical protein